MLWVIVLYLVAVAAGYFLGSFAWSQIIGTIVVKKLADEMSTDEYPAVFIMMAQRKAKSFTLGLIIWMVIVAAAVVGCYLLFKSYTWGLAIGLILSLFATLRSIPNLKEEFFGSILKD